jgi:3-methyladenine DNA glycosylase/8-oxoguanine DNA glycosylase
VALEATLIPRQPYSLALSARGRGDPTRSFRNGVLSLVVNGRDGPALARVHQRRDGSLAARIEGTAAHDATAHDALDRLRFVLAVDADHRPFLERFRDDPLLADPIRRLRGLRPLRTATVTHALLKALCGQLIQVRAAKLLEARILRFASAQWGDLHAPPADADLARYPPAALVAHGLAARRAAALVRISRSWNVEKLHSVPTEAAAARIEREPNLGPWSSGMVVTFGLGRFDCGLVGDLGLIKLCRTLLRRYADADDTRELLAPYGEWAGLASVYLLAGSGRAVKEPVYRALATKPPLPRATR